MIGRFVAVVAAAPSRGRPCTSLMRGISTCRMQPSPRFPSPLSSFFSSTGTVNPSSDTDVLSILERLQKEKRAPNAQVIEALAQDTLFQSSSTMWTAFVRAALNAHDTRSALQCLTSMRSLSLGPAVEEPIWLVASRFNKQDASLVLSMLESWPVGTTEQVWATFAERASSMRLNSLVLRVCEITEKKGMSVMHDSDMCSARILALSTSGRHDANDQIVAVYEQMVERNVDLEPHVYGHLMNALARQAQPQTDVLLQLYNEAMAKGIVLKESSLILPSLARAFSAHSHPEALFDSLQGQATTSVVNTLITGALKHHKGSRKDKEAIARSLYAKMKTEGLTPDLRTVVVMTSCVSDKTWLNEHLKADLRALDLPTIAKSSQRSLLLSIAHVFPDIIGTMSETGQATEKKALPQGERHRRISDLMKKNQWKEVAEELSQTPVWTARTFNMAIRCSIKLRKGTQHLTELCTRMKAKNFPFDKWTYGTLLEGYRVYNQPKLVKAILQKAIRAKCRLGSPALTPVFEMMSESKSGLAVLEQLIREMQTAGLYLDNILCRVVLKAYARHGIPERAGAFLEAVLGEDQKESFVLDEHTCGLFMSLCVRRETLHPLIIKLFLYMAQHNLRHTSITYAAMIMACNTQRDFASIVTMYDDMKQEDISLRPNIVSILVEALSVHARVDDMMGIVEKVGVSTLSDDAFLQVLEAVKNTGDIDRLVGLFRQRKNSKSPPNGTARDILVEAFNSQGRVIDCDLLQ